ncbi:MAG: Photosystem II manganese-stabilizing polypeptide [Alkalinema sp. CACIAM 70d]|nr:MAG: Photosystem II manganese-stabilizing polypeptide [Alkalinema sp. CACIAM 70d]
MRYRAIIAALLAFCLSVFVTACSEAPTSKEGLTYEEIHNTGLANLCPTLEETARGSVPLTSGQSYVLKDLCLQPTNFAVKVEGEGKRQKTEFVPGKVMTRYTSSIDAVEGKLTVNSDGSVTFKEEDGLDFQAVTVQLPGGEQFPMLFTIKGLVATSQAGLNAINSSTDFQGEFRVPSYRTSNFLDPKGRGLTTGYESAVAIPSSGDDEELAKENTKRFLTGQGNISLQITRVNGETGEVAGNFESFQPSESDMGSKEPSDVRIRGIFYGRVAAAA